MLHAVSRPARLRFGRRVVPTQFSLAGSSLRGIRRHLVLRWTVLAGSWRRRVRRPSRAISRAMARARVRA